MAGSLQDFRPAKKFFIGIDSDGCAFDTMEIKHKECFIPQTIRHFGLQPVSRFAREAAEFVNLYSKWRGINRFPAVIRTLDLLRERGEVGERGTPIPELPALREWIAREKNLANPALEAAVQQATGPAAEELRRVLAWSKAVNAAVSEMVYGVPPFPHVRESLSRAAERADLMVVSATPGEALEREWAEHDLARLVRLIAGQELGTKRAHLRVAAQGKYPSGAVLMIGDAPGDLEAARDNGALFYPIVPGREAESWWRFAEQDLQRFLDGQYPAVEAERIAEFTAVLPTAPPWLDGKR